MIAAGAPDPGETRRSRWRPLWAAGVALAIVGLALLVARPRVDPPTAVPYGGKRGASLARAAGLKVFWQRGLELRVLEPGTILQTGDQLRFVVRADRPRYLEVKARNAAGQERTIFPAGAQAALVRAGDALPATTVLDVAPGKEVVVALFGDKPFPVGRPPAPDLEIVLIEIDKGRPH